MTKWEYKVASFEDLDGPDRVGLELNDYGREGWELVTMITERIDPNAPWRTAIFKRPKSN